MFGISFLKRPASEALPHVQVKYVAATHEDDLAARARRLDKRLELAVYVATTSLEERRSATEAFIARKREGEAK